MVVAWSRAAWCVLGLMVGASLAAGCVVPERKPIRSLFPHGSLVQGDRKLDYDPGVTWFSLPNGLTVGLLPDAHTNLVSVDLRYMVGAVEDPPGKSGLAHLVEHMMFDQRAEPEGPTVADRLQLVALDSNAMTTQDATQFHSVGLAPALDDLLAIEAGRFALGCQGIDVRAFTREQAVVAQELDYRGTSTLADLARARLFGPNHAYTRSPGGRDLAKLTLADVCAFVESYYAPDRAILLVGGRFDAEALRQRITDKFGAVKHRATGTRTNIAPITLVGGASELRIPFPVPGAIVAFPAAPPGSREALDDDLVDELMLKQLVEPWLVATAGYLGGSRAGVRYIAVTVADPVRLEVAVNAVYDAAAGIEWGFLGNPLVRLQARKHMQLLDNLESFIRRAQLCSAAFEIAQDKQCRIDELRSLESDLASRVRTRARLRVRARSHVIRIVPTKGGASRVRPTLETTEDIDVPVWHFAEDPAEAERPIVFPIDPLAIKVSEFRLPNGLRVVMAPGFAQPVIEARMLFPVGLTAASLRDDLTRYAAAEFLDHDFTSAYSPQDTETIQWIRRLGEELSVDVTDHTTFRIRGSSVFSDWHLWRLAWLLRDGVYAGGDSAAQVQFRGRKPDPATRLRQRVRELLFGHDHPYARDLDVAAASESLSVDDLEEFRRTYYQANGATLIIAGNFDPATMQRTVAALFESWPAGRAPQRASSRLAMHPAPGPTWIVHDDPSAVQVQVHLGFAARSSGISSRAARAVATEIIRSRLALVRTQLGASYGIRAEYQLTSAGDLFEIEGWVDAARAGDVVRRILTDLDKLRVPDDSFTSDFIRARRAALASALADPALPSVMAWRIERMIASGEPFKDSELLPAEIAAATLDSVKRVLAQDLDVTRMVGVFSGRPVDTAAAAVAAGVRKPVKL